MTLAVTNISTAIVKAELSESVDNVKDLCDSSSVNEWALHKPAFYGNGNDAWTVDAGEYSGFERALSVLASNYRLGDFRGYNHDAKAPSYFNGNQSYSYYQYETPNGTVTLSYGEMYYSSSGDGFNPQFHTLDEDGDGSLTGVRMEIDGTPIGSVVALTQSRNNVQVTGLTLLEGTYTLTAYYYTRISDVAAWVKDNEIEGGSVDLIVTEDAARFTITNTTVDPSSTTEGTETFDADWRVTNLTGSTLNYTFYWQLSDKNGTKSISVPGSSFVDYDQNVFEAATSSPTETWLLRMDDASGPILGGSVFDITVT